MAHVLWLLLSVVCAAFGSPNAVPVMQLSAQEASADDPYDDEITILAEPFSFLPNYAADHVEPSHVPNLRAGFPQQSNNPFWYRPPNTGTTGLLHNNLGNKLYLSNLNNLFQNLPSFPMTVNVPDTVNAAGNQFTNFWNRWQQFLNQAQQNAAQWQASVQNIKGDQYYQYGPPSHPFLYQLMNPTGNYFKSISQQEDDAHAPAYQVIAVMPMPNSPPIRVADFLRQRSMNYEKPQSDERISEMDVVAESNLEKIVEKEVKKDLTESLKEEAVFDKKDLKTFASGVAKEVASAVNAASHNPGKMTEVVVNVEVDDDSSSSSSSSEEDDSKDSHKVDKKEDDKKKEEEKKKVEDDSDSSDSSDSDSSESKETSTTASVKPTTQKQKTTHRHVSEESQESEVDSDELDSVERVAKEVRGSRPVKAELVKSTSTSSKH